MTADKHAKRAARQLAEREGISYTAARRRLADQAGTTEAQPAADEPPVLYPVVTGTCDPGCDGGPHPGAVCRTWSPYTLSGQPVSGWRTCLAASLPSGRASSLQERFQDRDRYGNLLDYTWVLALVYALLLDEQPTLAPDMARLRAAVEADDLDAVDQVMEPLDRAAARFLTATPERWWQELHPRLEAYVTRVETAPKRTRWDVTLMGYDSRVHRLAQRWRQAHKEYRNHSGYLETESIRWWEPREYLNALLIGRHGGHISGARVRLADGCPALVYAVEWGEAGPPTGYRVRQLVPGEHGNAGRLVPKLGGDGERVAAADCRPLDYCAKPPL